MYRVDHKIMNDTIFFLKEKTRYKHLKYAVEFNAFHELIRLGKKNYNTFYTSNTTIFIEIESEIRES